MSRRPQTKWIVNVKNKNGKLDTIVMKFRPNIGAELEDGRIVVGVNS